MLGGESQKKTTDIEEGSHRRNTAALRKDIRLLCRNGIFRFSSFVFSLIPSILYIILAFFFLLLVLPP